MGILGGLGIFFFVPFPFRFALRSLASNYSARFFFGLLLPRRRTSETLETCLLDMRGVVVIDRSPQHSANYYAGRLPSGFPMLYYMLILANVMRGVIFTISFLLFFDDLQ